jgi:DNA-binding NtrC family response regulator
MERACLIVDDEPQIRAYLKTVLEKGRYRTLQAENAAQAFRTVQMLDGDLSLLVTDINMPGDMDGLDLAYAVRSIFPQIPIVLVSGYADTSSTREPLREFSFVRKPFTPAAILEAARRAASGSFSETREASAA